MKQRNFILALTALLISVNASAITHKNKLVTDIKITKDDVEVYIEGGFIHGPKGTPFEGKRPLSLGFRISDGQNKNLILDLIIAAYANQLRLDFETSDVSGVRVITGVSNGTKQD